jgi:hypothetical protein
VRLLGVHPGATQFHRVPVVVGRVRPATQPITRLENRAPPAHRQLARGRHLSESTADDHDIRTRFRRPTAVSLRSSDLNGIHPVSVDEAVTGVITQPV